ncbi:carboxypeptidase-like regulatory domain-containing protein, partial [Candidatus Woesearchaeota archaeon]|nr:carboxypeptidase-like regulatory domain-containing protein [Candidatus Woesearchaeota archaeon]
MTKRGRKDSLSILLIIILALIFLISPYIVHASCCVNEQTTFSSTAVDVTCTDNLPSDQCFGQFYANVQTCKEVQECGCCVCNFGTANPTVYSGGDLRVSNNFCSAFCSPYPYQLISNLTTASCSQQQNAIAISGYVLDQNGNPVQNAQVQETSGSSDVTDAQGKYSLTILQTTTVVSASKANIQNSIAVNTVTKTTGWNITLDLTAVSADLVGRITPTISGVPSPTPLSNVVVTVTDSVNTFTTQTDAVGEFSFVGIPISTYAITANRCGFFPKSEQVTLQAPMTRKDMSLQSASQETLTGVITDLQNRPVEGVDIIVSPARGTVQKSDAQGIYRVTGLDSNCQYSITASKSPNYIDNTKTKSIYATDAITTNTLDFVLEPSVMFDFCTDIGDCRGEDLILGTPDDCTCPINHICNVLTGDCDKKPTIDCCDYDFLCQPQQARSGITAQCGERETCSNVCAEILNCPAGKRLSNQNVDGVCTCSGETVTVVQSLADEYEFQNVVGKYCCPFSPISISALPCEFQQKAAIVGTVVSRVDGEPIDAAVIADPGTSGEVRKVSSFVDGKYVVFVDPNIDHTIRFERPPLYEPESRVVRASNLVVSDIFTLDVSLGVVARTCDYPSTPTVPDFEAENVICKNQVRLKWNNDYCSNEEGVQSFLITNENTFDTYVVDADKDEFIIEDLEWDELYTFSIQPMYADHNRPRMGEKVTLDDIDPGDRECEGRCDGEEFCLSRTERRICDENNKLTTDLLSPQYFPDCDQHQTSTGSNYAFVCMGPDANGRTKCVEESRCGFDLTNPIPFLGLLFDNLKCKKNPVTQNERNCYMDRSDTVKNFCFPCETAANMTCTDYDSELACEQNPCQAKGDCVWHETSFNDIGGGFCIDVGNVREIKYKQKEAMTDNMLNQSIAQNKCGLCSKEGGIFDNADCEQDVCSRLGNCFAELDDKNVSSCRQCSYTQPVTTCHDMKTKESCIDATGKNQAFALFSSSLPESARYSDDACGIGRCVWDDQKNRCFKDGNSDGQADCVTTEFGVESFNPICELDIVPPTTTPNSDTLILGNASDTSVINFTVSEAISSFYYCIYKEGTTACTDMKEISGTNSNIVKGTSVLVKPIEDFAPDMRGNGNYKVRYYAEDVFSNKELLKEVSVYVDTSAPNINIQNQSICTNCDLQIDCASEESYLSSLVLSIQSDELVSCEAYFIEPGESRETTPYDSNLLIDITTSSILSYPGSVGDIGLEDGDYRFELECEDIVGNEFKKQYTFHIDQLKGISRAVPKGPVKQTSITFSADTLKPSECTISIDGGSRLSMDQFVGGKKHSLEKDYVENTYHYYNIRCNEKNSITPNRCDSENYEFAIDNSAPETIAEINGREYEDREWSVFLTDPATLLLKANDESLSQNRIQFGIDHIVYCYREDLLPCIPGESQNSYRLFGQDNDPEINVRIPVERNMKLCYYAVDEGGNKEETKCGKILYTIPPAVNIESPEDNYITSKLHITVNATHDAENASEPLITTFNGEDFVAVAAQLLDNRIYGVLTYLFPGPNRVSARIKNGANIFGEDTINVYYDHTGPSIEMTSDAAIEYNEPFLISADIADEEWTAIRTDDDIGEVAEAYVSIQSSNLDKYYNMTKQGKQWSAYIIPIKDNLGFADYLPGEYTVTFSAKDSFGNENSEQFTIEIFDTTPANITVDLSTPNAPLPAYRDGNVFYTNDRMP